MAEFNNQCSARNRKGQVCGYRWNSRVAVPKSCPKCKRYDWNVIRRLKARLVAASEIEAHPTKSLLARDYVQQEPMSFKPEAK